MIARGVLYISWKAQVDRTLVATMASVCLTEVTGEFSKWLLCWIGKERIVDSKWTSSMWLDEQNVNLSALDTMHGEARPPLPTHFQWSGQSHIGMKKNALHWLLWEANFLGEAWPPLIQTDREIWPVALQLQYWVLAMGKFRFMNKTKIIWI